jgi:hypothetical protein
MPKKRKSKTPGITEEQLMELMEALPKTPEAFRGKHPLLAGSRRRYERSRH